MQYQQSWGTTSVEFTADSDTQFLLAKELVARLILFFDGTALAMPYQEWPADYIL
ncbi:MAG: hypothetical protein ACKVHE_31385 [Planctomycetales bacterium]